MYLHRNKIKEISRGVLYLPRLQVLGITENLIEEIPEFILDLYTLDKLFVEGNPIGNIPKNIFDQKYPINPLPEINNYLLRLKQNMERIQKMK